MGAGWSSLSLLAAVRPEVVKLDKALVQELPDDGARTVLKAVTDLAHQLGAVVVAEGRDRAARRGGHRLGADLGQGWLFGRPVRPDPPEEPEGRWQRVERPVRPGRTAPLRSVQRPRAEHQAGVLVAEHHSPAARAKRAPSSGG